MIAGLRLKHVWLLFTLLVISLVLACGDDDCGLRCRRTEPAIENIWPNDDGTFWTYDYTWRAWGAEVTTYPEKDSLPPVPSLDEIEAVLDHHPIGSDPGTVEGTYRLEFNGMVTTGPGVTAQNLEETLIPETGRARLASSAVCRPALMERLRLARPDLEAEIEALYPRLVAAQPGTPPAPNMIHGGAWEKTYQWIGTYGDLDTLLAWKFLEADLTERHEFTHQLVSSVANDVFLHARILGKTVVRSPGGHLWRALECLYVVDYGPFEIMGGLDGSGWRQYYDYGRVIYVPEVGPVYSYERALIAVGESMGTGYGDIEVDLTGTSRDFD